MTVEIVPLAATDMFAAAMVRRVALQQRLPWLPDLHTPDEDEAYWQTVLLAQGTVLGARVGGTLAGVIAFGEGWIHQLYVLPEFQGRRIGSALLARAIEDMDEVSLWTFKRNAGARAFYESHGFVVVEETDGRDNEEHEPDVCYLLR
jgi:ribosomal protein S18 acetylase RimI-like enzyme